VHPSQRHLTFAARATAAALSLLLGACSTDTLVTAAPTVPPSLEIAALIAAGGARVDHPADGQCVELGRDASGTVTVLLGKSNSLQQLVNWQFRPPFGCVGTPQCGFALLTVDPGGPVAPLQIAAAGISIPVPMRQLSQPEGQHVLRVELWDSDGTMPKDATGRVAQITIDVRQSCGHDGGAVPVGDASGPDARAPRDASQGPPADAARSGGGPRDSGQGPAIPRDASMDASPPDGSRAPDAAPAPDGSLPRDAATSG
jgi:hypothetical protein